MQKKFSLKNNRLAKTIIISGTILIVVAFVILRYEGFFDMVSFIVGIFRPIIIGGIIAFILNKPMNFFHAKYRRLFAGFKKSFRKKKHPKQAKFVSDKLPFITACITTYLIMFALLSELYCLLYRRFPTA